MILLSNHKRTEFGKPLAYREPMCTSENCQWCREPYFAGSIWPTQLRLCIYTHFLIDCVVLLKPLRSYETDSHSPQLFVFASISSTPATVNHSPHLP
jgi:hypothetical protein